MRFKFPSFLKFQNKREDFHSFFEKASDAFLVCDDQGKFVEVNMSLCNLLGYSKPELLSRNLTDIIDPEQLKADPLNFELAKTGMHIIRERRLKKKNGEIVEVEVNVKKISPNRFLAVGRDITEKKESDLKFKNLLERSLVGVYIHQDDYFKYVNPRMTEIFGYNENELLENPASTVIYEDDRVIAREMVRKRMEGEADAQHYEIRAMKKDGAVIWIEIFGSTILHKGKKALIGSMQDITERKISETELKRINHNIGERVKELNCLYRMSELANDPAKSMNDILQGCIGIIPPSYQYPEITTARIVFGDQKFESKNFEASVWKQEANINLADNIIGIVQVFYTKQMPDEQEGPFLKEERFLINTIADILSSAAERKNAEAVIKEQAETFQAIIENTKESIYLISPDYKILQFNKTAQERIRKGRGMELRIGADFRKYLYNQPNDIFYSMFEDALKGKHRHEEIKAQGITGEYFWFQSKTSPVYDPNGKLIGVTLLAEGIDDRKKAEEELRESEEKFRSLVEQSLVGVYIIQDNKLIYINPGFEKIFGYPKEQLINKMSFDGFVHEDDLAVIRKNYSLRVSGENPNYQYIFRGIKNDGSILHLEVIVSIIIYNSKPAVIGTLIDITDRIEEEKRIGKAVNDAQERERMQIGMELHDNVKQILAASLFSLDHLKSNVKDKKMVIETVDNLKNYTKEAITELRRLSHQLAPSINTDDTLADKIDKLVNTMNANSKLKVSINVDEFKNPLNSDIQLAFYRILQEQFNNILKYAEASTVLISIRPDHKNIHLMIKDDGKGFDTNTKKDGIGLENIKRRANVLGGKVKIISAPGNGCEVNVQIPIQ